jgi:hypothetical protein
VEVEENFFTNTNHVNYGIEIKCQRKSHQVSYPKVFTTLCPTKQCVRPCQIYRRYNEFVELNSKIQTLQDEVNHEIFVAPFTFF